MEKGLSKESVRDYWMRNLKPMFPKPGQVKISQNADSQTSVGTDVIRMLISNSASQMDRIFMLEVTARCSQMIPPKKVERIK